MYIMCICILHIHMYRCFYTYVYMYGCWLLCSDRWSVNGNIDGESDTFMYAYVYVYIYMYVYLCCMYISRLYVDMYIYIHTHTYIYMAPPKSDAFWGSLSEQIGLDLQGSRSSSRIPCCFLPQGAWAHKPPTYLY